MATKSGLSRGSKLKLLFILDAFPDPQAGTEGQFWLLFSQLDRSRIEPAVLLLRPSQFLQSQITDAVVKVLEVERLRSLSSLRRILAAVRWAKREKFDVAHIFFNDSALVFPLPLKIAGIRVVVSRRDLGFWYTSTNLALLRLDERFVDAVVANCRAVQEVVARQERYPSRKIRVIYNGIRRADVRSAAAAVVPGVPVDAPTIVIVANLRPLKRIDDAIRALARAAGNASAAHLLVIGEDRANGALASHRGELEALARELGVDERVHFLGKVEDPMPYIHRAALCMLCSETEGLSNAVIEYMFAGKPVVCTNAGGNAELVEDGTNGFVVPVGDVAGLAGALTRLLERRDLLDRMGTQSRERAIALFSPQRMTAAHLDLYAALRQGAA